jgi:hypothetical protein
MITFSKFGNYGNLGNQLHQLATLMGLSKKYGCDLIIPQWKYARYFVNPPKEGNIHTDLKITEPYYHYTPEFWNNYQESFKSKNVDILGWLQTEKYWQHCKSEVLEALQFQQPFYADLFKKFQSVFEKPVIAISIRRGDFITNPNFYLLPIEYYLGALKEYFPSYKNYHILFFSDDLDYCRMTIKKNKGLYFATGLNAIEQLCLMSMCDQFIISNSTFSWWGAMLGEKKHSKIIRPAYLFDGELLKRFDWKDHYPDRWIKYDHVSKIINIDELLLSKFNTVLLGTGINVIKTLKKLIRRIKNRIKVTFNK